jgi:hypothetical protein
MRRAILTKLSMEDLEANQELGQNLNLDTSSGASEPVVQFKGPLGEEVTKALQTAYNKDTLLGAPDTNVAQGESSPAETAVPTDSAGNQPEGKDVAMESQANDALGAGLGQGQIAPAGEAEPDIVAYAVNENTIDIPTIVDAAQEIDQADEDKEFIVIIDGTMDPENGLEGVPQERKVELVTALESICRSKNIPVFRSVQAFLQHEPKKD